MRLQALGLWLPLLAACFGVATAAERQPRFTALLSSGQRIHGDRLTDWHDPGAMPRLEGRALLEPSNALRWLRDRSLGLAELPAAYVELCGGDRLPGTVIEHRSGSEQSYEPLPPHLVVRSAQGFEPPENKPVSEIRVALPLVRRIVWQRRGRLPYQPGTAYYRDGRSLSFRAVRLSSGQAHVLLHEGEDRRIPWSDLAELHLPAVDTWTAWFDELAELCPNIDTRLYQVETTVGLVATTSLARLVPRFEGNSSDPDRWVHGIQPAWSLDILWVPCREMVFRRSWLPREAPLFRLPILAAGEDRPNGVGINRSTQGGPLRSQALDFGWGLSVHGRSMLSFDLHASVRTFRTQVCLDRSAGKGGCILARVNFGESRGNPLWQSPMLVGSEAVADSSAIGLSIPADQPGRLVLEIDPMLQGRPAGADPLEIRDHADWCDPLLELDSVAVQAELDKRLGRRLAAWKGWTIRFRGAATAVEAGFEVTTQRDERRPAPGTFHAAIQVKNKPLVLSRRWQVGPEDNWLLVAATRPINRGQEPKLEVLIGGEPVAEYPVPQRQHDANENRPLAISLAPYQRTPPESIEIELRQQAAADSAPVEYRMIEVTRQMPTLYQALEERAELTAVDPAAGGSATIVTDDRHSGVNSVRVSAGGEFRLPLDEAVRIRERPAWGEYRFVRFAVRKAGGGRASLGFVVAEAHAQTPRYDAGRGEASYGAATRAWPNELPKEWVVITRDLYADFGNFDATGLLLGCPNGEAASFDHVYLARGHHDFDRIPLAPSVEATNEKARYELARPLIERARPATVRIEFPDGRVAAGVLIQEQGEILTAGHVIVAPGRSARVQLADGTWLAAKTLGVAREVDLGLVRIEPPGKLPKLDPDAPAELPQNRAYIAIMPRPSRGEFEPASGAYVSLRRVFRSTVWTDLDPDGWLPGGPLLNADGRLIGIQIRPSRFGGILCTRFQEVWPHFQRLRNGEVFGAWQPGTEPLLGLTGSGVAAGYKLTEVTPEGPAAAAGLQVGDVLVRLDGRPVLGDDDIEQALAERDAGHEAVLDFTRGGAATQARVKLAPRVP
jgi:S1-C subfamily serine protease